jgi:hypothetical protein
MEMKTKVLLAVVALSYAPHAAAGNKAEYPNEKVAHFVIEKLDVTSLPSTLLVQFEDGHVGHVVVLQNGDNNFKMIKILPEYGLTYSDWEEVLGNMVIRSTNFPPTAGIAPASVIRRSRKIFSFSRLVRESTRPATWKVPKKSPATTLQ